MFEVHLDDSVVAAADRFVVLVVEVVVVDDETVEQPQPFAAVVVELLADQDVVEGLAQVLVDVGVVDVASVAVLLKRLRGIEAVVGAAARASDEVSGLLGKDVDGTAVLSVVEVTEPRMGVVVPFMT